MTRTYSIAPLIAAAALIGCDNGGNTIVLGPDGQEVNQSLNEEAVANVQLPPSIIASHRYRCKDNSLVTIDWLSDGTTNTARVKPEGGEAVTLSQAEAGGDYTAESTTLKGGPQAQSVTWNGKSCSR